MSKRKKWSESGVLLFRMSFEQVRDQIIGVPIYDPYSGRYRACTEPVRSWLRSYIDRGDLEEYIFLYSSLPEDPVFGGLHIIAMKNGEWRK